MDFYCADLKLYTTIKIHTLAGFFAFVGARRKVFSFQGAVWHLQKQMKMLPSGLAVARACVSIFYL
jgi:hypothetical protein